MLNQATSAVPGNQVPPRKMPEVRTAKTPEPQKTMMKTADAAAPALAERPAWEPIVPFDVIETPPLPLDGLPSALRGFVEAVAEAIQVPPGLVLINALACMAVAVQGRARVAISTDHSEPLNLYVLAAMLPGERKSAVVDICKAPLVDWQRRAAELEAPNRKRALSERKSQEKIIEAKRGKLFQIKDEDERRAEISSIAELEIALPDVPALPRLFADDVTPEATAVILAEQSERLGIIESEAGLFEILAGRYSGGVPNLDIFLKAWNGESAMIDRRRGEPVALSRPLLSICISAQPDVVAGLADKPGFRGRGLLARFFYLLPESRVGYRTVDVSPVPSTVKETYAAKLEDALEVKPVKLPDGEIVPHMLRLSPEAGALRMKFAEHIERAMRPDGDLEDLQEWGNKLPGNMLRMAGLLHFWGEDRPLDAPISGQTMNAAISLAAVLVDHAKAAFALMGADEKLEAAKRVLAWIQKPRSEPLREFSARACWQGVKGRFRYMAEVQAGLDILEERSCIVEAPRDTKTGRPSRRYIVNPSLLEVKNELS